MVKVQLWLPAQQVHAYHHSSQRYTTSKRTIPKPRVKERSKQATSEEATGAQAQAELQRCCFHVTSHSKQSLSTKADVGPKRSTPQQF